VSSVLVSAIIPTYNRADYIAQAVSSCLAQTYPCYEIIVVDDGSTDNTPQVLGQFGTRIQVVRQKNGGLAAARNAGIRAATGQYLGFLDDDDLWLPCKLERQVQALSQDHAVTVIYSDFAYVHEEGKNTVPRSLNRPQPRNMLEALLMGNWLAVDTFLIRRDCFGEIGFFNEELRAHEDWDFWLRLAARYRWSHVPEELTLVLWHDRSLSRNARLMDETTWKVLDKYFASASGARLPRSTRRRAYSAAHYRIAMHYIACAQYWRAARHMGLGFTTAPERLFLESSKITLLLRNVASRGYRRAPSAGTQREKRKHQ